MEAKSTRRLKALASFKERRQTLDAWIDYRFVREVERLEREGRIKSRGFLEAQLDMTRGTITDIRRGRRSPSPAQIVLFYQHFQADRDHIETGVQLDRERAAPRFPLLGKEHGDKEVYFPPFAYEYHTPAGWRVGPQPEQDPRHCPIDPTGEKWEPHPLAKEGKKTLAKKAPAREAEASEGAEG